MKTWFMQNQYSDPDMSQKLFWQILQSISGEFLKLLHRVPIQVWFWTWNIFYGFDWNPLEAEIRFLE